MRFLAACCFLFLVPSFGAAVADDLTVLTALPGEAAARWLHRWLLGGDQLIREVETRPDPLTDEQSRELSKGDWTARQLQCTPSGQVLLMKGERSVFQINADIAATLKSQRAESWNRRTADEKRQLVRETIATSNTTGNTDPAPHVKTIGRIARDGYSVQKLVLTAEPGLRLPALAFVPDKPSGIATLYLHGASIKADAAPGGPLESLAKHMICPI